MYVLVPCQSTTENYKCIKDLKNFLCHLLDRSSVNIQRKTTQHSGSAKIIRRPGDMVQKKTHFRVILSHLVINQWEMKLYSQLQQRYRDYQSLCDQFQIG